MALKVGKAAAKATVSSLPKNNLRRFRVLMEMETRSDGTTQEGDVWVTPWNPFGIKSDITSEASFGGLCIKSHVQMELVKCSFKP